MIGILVLNGLNDNVTELVAVRENFPQTEFSWSVFSRIWTEYGEVCPNAGKYGPEKLRIRTLFMQC